ncbi:MAG: hypothetical protein EZS28_022633 [Streblomastix strix]|uniref:Uncharacterized protein n=1 Tax=Streblomastix strix TaxID=222440 RepID=A0A5J4VH34_9EUKA|nr:MAG: hypothetical protein EZS28_022633 [Streblomastix strix]
MDYTSNMLELQRFALNSLSASSAMSALSQSKAIIDGGQLDCWTVNSILDIPLYYTTMLVHPSNKFIERDGMKFCEGLADKKITNIGPKWIPANIYDELLFERLTKVLNTETKLN